jgi:hypothetical protein
VGLYPAGLRQGQRHLRLGREGGDSGEPLISGMKVKLCQKFRKVLRRMHIASKFVKLLWSNGKYRFSVSTFKITLEFLYSDIAKYF